MPRFALRGLALVLVGGLCAAPLTGCASSDAARTDGEATGGTVVDTGYGTYDAEDGTGSAAVVEAGETEADTAVTLADLLRGRVAGVDVREVPGGIAVSIRGAASDPLYVLDGMQITAEPGGVLAINPRDVASITVLKGPETALYGARGAHGVIVIRTKTGG